MAEEWRGGDVNKGAELFKKKCQWCHNIEVYEENKKGPNLWNVFGRISGQNFDYKFSEAHRNKKIEWTGPNLFDYLKDPAAYIPGTKKNFPTINDEQDRRDLIAFIKTKRESESSLNSK